MTLEEANEMLRAIKRAAADLDDEAAHGLEDDLHAKVLEAIASGATNKPRELATVALRSAQIAFSRWCA